MSAATLAPRLDGIGASPASLLRRRAQELRAAGRAVIELGGGDLDFPTPAHVVAAAHRAAERGETRYTNADGTPELKEAVQATLERRHGLAYRPDEIIVCNGSSQAMFNALLATLSPGEEVLIPSPGWPSYAQQVRLAGGTPVPVSCAQNHGFRLSAEDLGAAITPRTRWLILNSPVNPSGVVYGEAELAAFAAVLLPHPEIRIIADGLYEAIVFDGRTAPTIAAVEPRLQPRTLTVGGVAKAYAMMGWRVGYAAGPAPLIAAMTAIQSHTTSCASSISQAAALAALTGPQELLAERARILGEKRDRFAALLNRCAGLACTPPEGTFYLLVGCAGILGKTAPDGRPIETDRDAARYLLDAAEVAVAVGADFGVSPYLRVSFAHPVATIEEAGRRIAAACAALR